MNKSCLLGAITITINFSWTTPNRIWPVSLIAKVDKQLVLNCLSQFLKATSKVTAKSSSLLLLCSGCFSTVVYYRASSQQCNSVRDA